MSSEQRADNNSSFRVLCLDGGGMRGCYTAAYLCCIAEAFAKKRSCAELDIGAAFNLIVGTSTGAMIAAALALGIAPNTVVDLYKKTARRYFPRSFLSA